MIDDDIRSLLTHSQWCDNFVEEQHRTVREEEPSRARGAKSCFRRNGSIGSSRRLFARNAFRLAGTGRVRGTLGLTIWHRATNIGIECIAPGTRPAIFASPNSPAPALCELHPLRSSHVSTPGNKPRQSSFCQKGGLRDNRLVLCRSHSPNESASHLERQTSLPLFFFHNRFKSSRGMAGSTGNSE
jgi:hypothetical protein